MQVSADTIRSTMTRKTLIALLLALVAGLSFGCTRMASLSVIQVAPELKNPPVRVLLGDAFDSLTITAAATFRVDGVGAHDDTSTYYTVAPIVVRRGMTGLMLVDRGWYILQPNLKAVRISPHTPRGYIRVDGRPFRGEMIIKPTTDSEMNLVNVVGMDAYLFGVVPGEIGFSDPGMIQAMEAQAVAARTYAFSHLGQYGGKDYDLRSDVMDQVYGGIAAEKPLVTQAVWETRGVVLRYDGGYVNAYYHSTCGGRTENIEDVWDKPAQPYLVGVDDDAYCEWSKYWEWEEVCTRAWLDSNVTAFLINEQLGDPADLGRLTDLQINGRLRSGRVESLTLHFQYGLVTVRGDRSRWALGRPSRNGPILPSSDYWLEFEPSGPDWSRVVVRGRGYGHGVGMCQTGAIGRARAGQDFGTILLHYYQGARLEKAY